MRNAYSKLGVAILRLLSFARFVTDNFYGIASICLALKNKRKVLIECHGIFHQEADTLLVFVKTSTGNLSSKDSFLGD
jgi:hypothetical protein